MISFRAADFRNLANVELEPCEGVNVICGDNGHGKTSILEGIGLFSGMKSFRGAKNSQMIMKDKQSSRLSMDFFSEQRDQSAVMHITDQSRDVSLNGVKKETASALMGVFCAVVFAPDKMTLVNGAASERRRFIDAAIGQIMPRYAFVLYKFNQILQQRNTLLKEISQKQSLLSTLDVWDSSLASYGAVIACRRAELIRLLRAPASAVYEGISSGREPLSLRYQSPLSAVIGEQPEKSGVFAGALPQKLLKAVEQAYYDQLCESRASDLKLGFTFHGPQRDDMEIDINERSARIFGSQGQKRSAVLALKLAESSVMAELIGEQPVALLDDVMSELDKSRQEYLLNRLSGWQVFITCCDAAPVRLMDAGRIFCVRDGAVGVGL